MLTQQNGKIMVLDAVRSIICKVQNKDKKKDNLQEAAAPTEMLRVRTSQTGFK
jgi:hypothetical protein